MADHYHHDRLRFWLAADRPAVGDLEVFATHRTELLGAPVTFQVIGSSHFVRSEGLGFYEIASCKSLEGEDVRVLPLAGWDGEDDTSPLSLSFETATLSCAVEAHTLDLDAFDADRPYDLEYAFGPRAHTAIAVDGEATGEAGGGNERESGTDGADAAGYETYHTYPEYDLTVYTRTTLRRK